MNLKEWNIKKGLKRIWIIGSVFCLLYPLILGGKAYSFGMDVSIDVSFLIFWVFSQVIWCGLLYLCFWVARGFVDNNNKKVGF